uniref:Solute carrier family 15 member 3 n=1 Tax=Homo sapiens TaxID=9606 RepID=A0A7P0Z4G8_HUMAN
MPAPRAREQPRVPGERQPLLPRGARGPRRWRRAAGAAVLLVEMLERAAFFGVTANLVLYLNSTNFNWTGEQATRAALVFLGASYLLAPVGGWLADVYLGRYRAVALSLLLYLAASGLLPATAFPDGRSSFCGEMPASPLGPACPSAGCPRSSPSPYCAPVLYAGLLLLGLAASSVRSNLTSFGADQVMDLGRDATRRFFNWFYWSINLGAVLSLLVVAFIQQNISFLLGYSIPVGCVGLAFFIFLFATPVFITKPPMGSQVSSMLKLALQNCCPQLWQRHSARDRQCARVLADERSPQPGASPQEDIANFQVLVKILPVMVTLVPYWMVYFQSTYVLQGLHLHIPNIFPANPANISVALRAQGSSYTESWRWSAYTTSTTTRPCPSRLGRSCTTRHHCPSGGRSLSTCSLGSVRSLPASQGTSTIAGWTSTSSCWLAFRPSRLSYLSGSLDAMRGRPRAQPPTAVSAGTGAEQALFQPPCFTLPDRRQQSQLWFPSRFILLE